MAESFLDPLKGDGQGDQEEKAPPPAPLRGLCVLAKQEEDAHGGRKSSGTPDCSAAGVVSGNRGWPASLPLPPPPTPLLCILAD